MYEFIRLLQQADDVDVDDDQGDMRKKSSTAKIKREGRNIPNLVRFFGCKQHEFDGAHYWVFEHLSACVGLWQLIVSLKLGDDFTIRKGQASHV